MGWTAVLLGFFLLKVVSADGGFVMIGGSNGSRSEEKTSSDAPPTEDRCRGYYDVMGQWDPPFVCQTGSYLYCCGTCGFRFCCEYKDSRLDQNTCTNYDTPVWMLSGQTPFKKSDPRSDRTKDSTNFIVYIICGVVAIMALVGIFTKLGLEKAHRPQRENMSRAVASVMQGACAAEHEGGIGMRGQHYDNVQQRLAGLAGVQLNSTLPQQQPYPHLGPLAHVYEQPQPSKELNKYASLKAVAEKANGDFYSKRHHVTELATKDSLPLQPIVPIRIEHREPVATYISELPCPKQNGQKPRSGRGHIAPTGPAAGATPGVAIGVGVGTGIGAGIGARIGAVIGPGIEARTVARIGTGTEHGFWTGTGPRIGSATGVSFQTGTGPRTGTATGVSFQTGTGPRIGSATGVNFQTGTGTRTGTVTGVSFQTGTGPRIGSATGVSFQTGTGPRIGSATGVSFQTGTGTRTGTVTGVSFQTGTGPRIGTATGVSFQTGTGPRIGTGFGAGIGDSIQIGPRSSTGFGTGIGASIHTGTGPRTGGGYVTGIETNIHTGTGPRTGSGFGSGIGTNIHTGTGPRTGSGYGTGIGANIHTGTGPRTGSGYGTGIGANIHTGTGPRTGSGFGTGGGGRSVIRVGGGIGEAIGIKMGPGIGARVISRSGMRLDDRFGAEIGAGIGVEAGVGVQAAMEPRIHHMAYSSNTIAAPGMLRGWDGTDTAGRRKICGPRKAPCLVDQVNELHTTRSHHYLPTQPYFITNSKTEVTV
ncbi:protein shisa-9A [Denticeps clupeoides]|uniref:Shisa N-terminal domain-containing protein n=1 Tax=Denticeps clupeoides TaxID=299321 RepID=A0AAY4AU00_9TELE|nr:putative per-hexamer repeat protein 5 [Denticeps clupeoides]